MSLINVIKADGRREPYSEKKILDSMSRAGISNDLQTGILKKLAPKLHEDIETWELTHHINDLLSKSDQPYFRSKLNLKQAIMMLGPTGYPFEDFVSEILKADGYSTEVRQVLNGSCVTHEIDVLATKAGKQIAIEAKFHNNLGARTEVQVSLYTKARFEDVKLKNKIDEAWIVTNTKATTDAIAYAECVGMEIIGWNHPVGGSLRERIEKYHLHPITILQNLPQIVKNQLLANHIVLCKDVCINPQLLSDMPLSKEEKKKALDEIDFICKTEASHRHEQTQASIS